MTATELATLLERVNRPLDVRVPTLLVAGELDSQLCKENVDAAPAVAGGGGGAVGDLLAPFEDATLEPYDLNQALNAQEYFTAINDWIAATLGS